MKGVHNNTGINATLEIKELTAGRLRTGGTMSHLKYGSDQGMRRRRCAARILPGSLFVLLPSQAFSAQAELYLTRVSCRRSCRRGGSVRF
jgi:hypothetical protein